MLENLLEKIGQNILKSRLVLLILILIITLLAAIHLPKLQLEDDEITWFSPDDSTLLTYRRFKSNFNNSEFVIVAFQSENAFSPTELSYLDGLSTRLGQINHISEVFSLTTAEDLSGSDDGLESTNLIPRFELSQVEIARIKERIHRNPFFRSVLVGSDYQTLAILLAIKSKDVSGQQLGKFTKALTQEIREILTEESRLTGRSFHLAGNVIIDGQILTMMTRDLQKFFPLSMLLVTVILVFMFRNLAATLFPVLTVFFALIWVLGLKSILHSPITPVSTTLVALISIIGIANSIHLINHYRLAIAKVGTAKHAWLKTYSTVGIPCFFTAFTTMIGFGSLGISKIPAIRDLGYYAAFGIFCAFTLSMILVPSGFLFLKKIPFALYMPSTARPERILTGISGLNLKYPRTILACSGIIIVTMLVGIPRIKVEPSLLNYLRKSTQIWQDTIFIDEQLAGCSNIETILYGDTDQFEDPAILNKIVGLQDLVLEHSHVSAALSLTDYVRLIYRALNANDPAFDCIPPSREAVAQSLLMYELSGGRALEDYTNVNYDMARISILVKQMNSAERIHLLTDIQQYLENQLPELKAEITGLDNLVQELTQNIITTQIKSLGTAFLIILLLMLMLFGIKGGLLSILPNIFPIVFVMGIMGLANFRLNLATAIIASIAIGIVVDDTIHYFAYFRFVVKTAGSLEDAMQLALLKVGRALIFTSIVLILGFLIFLFSETQILRDFGILSSIAVLTALFGDMFIGPVLLSKIPAFSSDLKTNKCNPESDDE